MNVIDLFAGCGGFSTGFAKAGFEITKAVEFDKMIAHTYKMNHKSTSVIVSDIGQIDNDKCFSENESDVIIGGPPCQGFSMAGARIRNNFVNDPRNYLFKHYFNIVKIVKPKAFIIENVKGILTMSKGGIFKEIVTLFSDKDNFNGDRYYLHYKVVNSEEYGIPQHRERVIIIGLKNKDFNIDKCFEETKEEINKCTPNILKPVTVWDALSNLPNETSDGICIVKGNKNEYQEQLSDSKKIVYNHYASKHSDVAIDRMKKIKPGQNWTCLDENIHSVHSGAYGRLIKDGIAPTITTRFDTPSGGMFIHPTKNRTLTPREAARIQSFPDSFIFYGSKSSICKQIGNAVPPKLAYFLALVIRRIIENEDI